MTEPKPSPVGSDGSVLARIEGFDGRPDFKETYHYRRYLRADLPKTLVDTFVYDIWRRLEVDVKPDYLDPEHVVIDHVREAIALYATRDPRSLNGLRPSTHALFVRSLTEAEREQLAEEVLAHARRVGIAQLGESDDEWSGMY